MNLRTIPLSFNSLVIVSTISLAPKFICKVSWSRRHPHPHQHLCLLRVDLVINVEAERVVVGHLSPFRSLTAHMRGSLKLDVVLVGVSVPDSRPTRDSVSAAMGAVVATKGRESTTSKELPP